MFNKQPRNITNHYHNVFRSTTEIDYDKLAKAIINAQQELEQQRIKDKENNTTKSPFSITLMCLSTLVISIVFSLLIVFFGIILAFAFVNVIKSQLWQNLECIWKIIASAVFALVIVNILLLALVVFLAGIEIFKENNKDLIISSFSGIIGFAAFIVSIFTLFQSNSSTKIMPYLEEIINLLTN